MRIADLGMVSRMRLLPDDVILSPATRSDTAAHETHGALVNDPQCGPPLRVYFALTDGRLGAELTPEERFYNRYYWFRRFANLHRDKFGEDAGIEQQAFQLLEQSAFRIDWLLVERLDAAARPAL